MLIEDCKNKGESDNVPISPYGKRLAELFNMNRTRILAFKNKPPVPKSSFFTGPISFINQPTPAKRPRFILQTLERILDAPDILDYYCLNLLDWDCNDVLAISLQNIVYLWDAFTKSNLELMTVNDDDGPVKSVSFASDGHQIVVGLHNSHVQLWDTVSNKKLRTLQGGHSSMVGSLAWNHHVLTTGGMDSLVINNDL